MAHAQGALERGHADSTSPTNGTVVANRHGVMVLDESGVVIAIDAAASALLGLADDAAIGCGMSMTLGEHLQSAERAQLEAWLDGWKNHRSAKTHRTCLEMRRAATGHRVPHCELSFMPVRAGAVEMVIVTVSAVDRRVSAIAAANRDLERSNADLRQFAYVASHDLREPLRMVTGYLRLVQRRYAPQLDATAQEFIGMAHDGAMRMHALMGAMLDYAQVGSSAPKVAPTDIGEVVSEVLAILAPDVAARAGRVVCEPLPTVSVDRLLMARLFQNLIGNALKYHGDRSPLVRIDACASDGLWTFSVSDNGIGIAPEDQERVFQIFQRLRAHDDVPGTGIGLAVCFKIVERHGGRLWLESRLGEGSTFRFTIPA